jgi:hypothetical protein
MHLLEEETITSIPVHHVEGKCAEGRHGIDHVALARAFTARAMSAMGFTMPDVVSQWMTQTWLIAGSSSSFA